MEEETGLNERVWVNLGARVTFPSINSNYFRTFPVMARIHGRLRGGAGGKDCIMEEEQEHSCRGGGGGGGGSSMDDCQCSCK